MSNFSQQDFEEALRECAAEPIHQIGNIQPHGAALVLSSDSQHKVLQASENLANFVDLPTDGAQGKLLIDLIGETTVMQVEQLIQVAKDKNTATGIVSVTRNQVEVNLQAHLYVSGEMFVLELEHDEGPHQEGRLAQLLLEMEQKQLFSESDTDTSRYFDEIATLVRKLTDYDSVMVYRFDADWNGEVISQSRVETVPSYLGLHFPASDIPPQARRLYTINLVRIVTDVSAHPVPVLPVLNPTTQQPLDMTYSALRSLSPVHMEYLCNIGVQASMSISLLQNGQLWGMIVCHHQMAKRVSIGMREAAIFISLKVSAQLRSNEVLEQHRLIDKALRINGKLLQTITRNSAWIILQQLLPDLQTLLTATGIIIVIEGQRYIHGKVPEPDAIDSLLNWLSSHSRQADAILRQDDAIDSLLNWLSSHTIKEVFSCDNLAEQFVPADEYREIASGILTSPLSSDMRNCIIWLRAEKTRTIQWAGKHEEGLMQNQTGKFRLNPRKSFEIITELWRGCSTPWSHVEVGIGTLLTLTLVNGLAEKKRQEQTYEQQKKVDAKLLIAATALRNFDEEQFKIMIRTSLDGFWITDFQGRFLEVNTAYCDLTGYSMEELLTMRIMDVETLKTEEEIVQHIDKIFKTGRVRFECLHRSKDGRTLNFDVNAHFSNIYGGRFYYFLRDVTERKASEAALAESRNLLLTIIDSAPIGVYWKDRNLRYLGCNMAFAKDAGMAHPQDIIGKDDFQMAWGAQAKFYSADDRVVMESEIERLFYDSPHTTPSGQTVWLRTSKVPLRNQDNEVIGLLGVYEDITERKQLENEREEALSRLQKIASRVPGLVYQYRLRPDGSSCMPFASEAIHEIYRVSPEEVREDASKLFAVLHPDDYDGVPASILKSAQDMTPWRHEYRVKFDDGTVRWLFGNALPEREADGSILWHGFINDITGLKQIETALRQSETKLQAMLDAIPDLLIEHGLDGRIHDIHSPRAGFLLAPAQYLLGKLVSVVLPPDAAAVVMAALQEANESGHSNGRQFPLVLPQGRAWFELSVARKATLPCEDSRFVVLARDITERKLIEEKLRVQNEEIACKNLELERASRMKSEFLAAMSHEIRTPMNGVIGMVDVLHQTSLNDDQVEMVDIIRESAFSLLGIIEDILDFSKIEAGKLEIERLPTAVAEVVEKVCIMLDRLAENKEVVLTLFTDPAIPTAVLSDAQRLRQIVINLANNAIKFSSGQGRPGRVSVQAVLVERELERVVVEIRVIDNGIGMDQESQTRLFSPFTQADASTTRRFGGTGLGLSISHNLVQLMGGEITVQSSPDQGSTFTARLPFVTVPDKTDDNAAQSLVTGLSCLVVGWGPEGIADHLAAYLTAAGAVVDQAPNLAAAQERASAPLSGPWVWLIDAGNTLPLLEELRAITSARPEQDIRLVVIGRGKRRRPPRQDDDQIVRVDGNVLTRQTVLQAMAIAAGQAQAEISMPPSGKGEVSFTTPSRADALREGRLILVAEDNTTNQKVILQQLALLGFAADLASDGHAALERWRSGDYVMLLTDLHMPKMDGYELTAAIRAEENSARHIIIIALTAYAIKDEAKHCCDAGMNDYLSKPATLADLKAMLEKWLPDADSALQPAAATLSDIAMMPATLSTASKPVDVSILAALVGDDPVVVRDFLQDFRGSASQITVELKNAYADRQSAQMSALAHRLKSSARSVGALELGELCAEIEQAGKAGQLEVLSLLLPRFEAEMAAVGKYLDAL